MASNFWLNSDVFFFAQRNPFPFQDKSFCSFLQTYFHVHHNSLSMGDKLKRFESESEQNPFHSMLFFQSTEWAVHEKIITKFVLNWVADSRVSLSIIIFEFDEKFIWSNAKWNENKGKNVSRKFIIKRSNWVNRKLLDKRTKKESNGEMMKNPKRIKTLRLFKFRFNRHSIEKWLMNAKIDKRTNLSHSNHFYSSSIFFVSILFFRRTFSFSCMPSFDVKQHIVCAFSHRSHFKKKKKKHFYFLAILFPVPLQ